MTRIPPSTCPRCGDDIAPGMSALSRADSDTEVCSLCGSEEALGQYQEQEITAVACITVAPRGVLPEWARRWRSQVVSKRFTQ